MQPTKPKNKKLLRFGVVCVILLVSGSELARRALTGHGHLHTLAITLYHQYKAARLESARAALGLPEQADEPLVLYDDALAKGWQDWSWAKHDLASTAHVLRGSHAITLTPEAYKGVYLHHAPLGTAGYGTLQCYIFGTSALKVGIVDNNGKFGKQVSVESYRRAEPTLPEGWNVIRIPLIDLGISRLGDSISGLVFQASTAATQPDLFLDDVSLLPDLTLPTAPTAATVAITIDETADRHPISPYIYGMAFAPADYVTDLHLGSNRWGGNDKSRYNWVEGNADNAARDWRWDNHPARPNIKSKGPSSAADTFFLQNRVRGAVTVLTVPTLGWVARDADNTHASLNVPPAGGRPLTTADGTVAGYDPTDNRRRTSIRSMAHKPGVFADVPSKEEAVIYQDEWVHHLVKTFGNAAQGGVLFFAMDNEPDLWDTTHTDVHPGQMGYDDMLSNFLEYATAVKAVDPTAQVTGPVSSGWTALLYSSLDRGDDNFHTHADCTRHGNEAFILWFLKQVHAHDVRVQKRTLDALDIHYYPQGQGLFFNGGLDRDTQTRRLRATRSLWDADYTDESWIGEPVRLLPRLKEWIAAGYPGTKIALTEWNFGGDNDMNGALTIADVLGIYGREDVFLANYWAAPQQDSPGYLAFRLYRNADGQGHGFGDRSCRAISANPGQVSCFAAVDTPTGDLTVILINKMHKATVATSLAFRGKKIIGGTNKMWLLSVAHPKTLIFQTGPSIRNSSLTVALPPYSITLIRLRPRHNQ